MRAVAGIAAVAFLFISFSYHPAFAGPELDKRIKSCLLDSSSTKEYLAKFKADEASYKASHKSQDILDYARMLVKLFDRASVALDNYCTLLQSVAAPEKVADPSAVCDQTIDKFRSWGGAVTDIVLQDETENYIKYLDDMENQILHYCKSWAPNFALRAYWKHLSKE